MGLVCNIAMAQGSDAQIDTQATAAEADATADMGAAGSDADTEAGGGLHRLSIRSASDQGKPGHNQKNDPEDIHHTNAFHRSICART